MVEYCPHVMMLLMSERFTLPVAVFLILKKGDKILLSRRKGTSWYDGSYDFVAGHIDGNESFVTALCREAKEEIGITIDEKDAKFVNIFHALYPEDGTEYIYAAFEVEKWEGEPTIMEPDKCDDLRWFSLADTPENITPGTRDILKALRSKVVFAESGF